MNESTEENKCNTAKEFQNQQLLKDTQQRMKPKQSRKQQQRKRKAKGKAAKELDGFPQNSIVRGQLL